MSPSRGIERWIPRVWLFFLVLFLAIPRSAQADAPVTRARAPLPEPQEDSREADYRIGEQGHRFRVRFDPESRIWLGFAGALLRGEDGVPRGAPEITAGLSYRAMYYFGRGRDQIIWQIDSRVLSGYVRPFGAVVKDVPALDAAVYSGSLLRHDESPSIVLPASPPVGIPFPFDVGFETEIGRVYIPSDLSRARKGGAKVPMLDLGVMRAALILDPWRTGKQGRSFEIGIGARYGFSAYIDPLLQTTKVVHRVAPMTAGSLRFRIQSQDGLALLDVRADVMPHWTSESVWKFAAQSGVHLRRTLVAVNDQPIAAVLEGGYRFMPDTDLTRPIHDVRVSLGLSFNIQLK